MYSKSDESITLYCLCEQGKNEHVYIINEMPKGYAPFCPKCETMFLSEEKPDAEKIRKRQEMLVPVKRRKAWLGDAYYDRIKPELWPKQYVPSCHWNKEPE